VSAHLYVKQMFTLTIFGVRVNLWPAVKIGICALITTAIIVLGRPAILLTDVLKGGLKATLIGLVTLWISPKSYNSMFTATARIIGNTVGNVFMPLIVSLLGLINIRLSSSAQFIIRTCIYILTTVIVMNAVDKFMSSKVTYLDLTQSWITALQRTLILWNLSCWITDWMFYLAGR